MTTDAQFTWAKVLRPFPNFEQVYQGQAGEIPIAFPGTLDPAAGSTGISPYLLGGLPTPFGAKVCLWIPQITGAEGEGVQGHHYVYLLHWRMRTIGDFERNTDQGWHLATQPNGAPDTVLAPSPSARIVLPAATESIIYQDAQPAATSPFVAGIGPGIGNLRPQEIAVPSDGTETLPTAGLPLLPPGSAPDFANAFPTTAPATRPLGAFQQGILNPNASDLAPYSIYRPYFTIAKGDELIITCTRRAEDDGSTAPWDFSTIDQEFSNVFGINAVGPTHTPYTGVGIYMLVGANPS